MRMISLVSDNANTKEILKLDQWDALDWAAEAGDVDLQSLLLLYRLFAASAASDQTAFTVATFIGAIIMQYHNLSADDYAELSPLPFIYEVLG